MAVCSLPRAGEDEVRTDVAFEADDPWTAFDLERFHAGRRVLRFG